ncbi:hypothetical protein CXK91_02795 [Stutzerimonas stutzeri]|uniref:Uncharacterized protein n=1 Tax=Stutzerimonas stutzeri TaxID=316 RepID=A0A2S4AUD1_STUST|nr:hypothetical protein CXK91_02795 [Stutzerimonas stutzeri]
MTATVGSVDATTAFVRWARGNRARFDDRIDVKTVLLGGAGFYSHPMLTNGTESEISVAHYGARASAGWC